MIKKNATVKLLTGLHARPAADLVKLASTFKSNIILVHDNKEINVKDIWEVLNGGVDSGDEISIKCDGEDENVAIEQIATFISNEEVS